MVEKAGEEAGIVNSTRTCFATPAAICWPMRGMTRAAFSFGLGHADIKHTAKYSELSAKPFRDFWRG
jgi:hypothetical protein